MKVTRYPLVKLILIFIHFLFAIPGYAQIILNKPNTTGEYFSVGGVITLAPGFSSGGTFRAYIIPSLDQPLVSSASTDQNYVISNTIKTSDIKSIDKIAGLSVSQLNQTIAYFDGLGRPLQTVMVQASPDIADVVQPFACDAFGREPKKYQPYASTTNGGAYRSNALTDQAAFYSASQPGLTATTFPFSVTVFEASPLNRVTEQGAPGSAWQPVAGNTTGHTQKIEYSTNNASTAYTTAGTGYGVRLYTATPVTTIGAEYQRTLSSSSGLYAAGQLYLTIIKDENWVVADGKAGTIEEYKDKEGKVVLKRMFNKKGTTIETLSTYYVYDDMGNLSFMLPPGANPDSGTIDQTTRENYCYQYRYDGRQRLIEKKIPGTTQWISMVYNKLDQVVLMQDARQAEGTTPAATTKKWNFTKYDALGRVIITGIYNASSTVTRADLQTSADANANLWESRSVTGDYSNIAIPTGSQVIYTYNYYDDYSFPGGDAYTYGSKSLMTKGLLTGSKVRVLDGTEPILTSLNFYDNEGRLVKNFKQHYLSGTQNAANYDETLNTYSFAGDLTASTRIHHVGTAATTIADTYTYDQVGRKLTASQSINGVAAVMLSKLDYTETGQSLNKSLHSADNGSTFLQSSSYVYNERGWLKSSSSTPFSFQLNYQDGTTPQYNGNISNQLWGIAGNLSNKFTYGYDKLNRLLTGISTGVVMSETLDYDVMGNIKTLKRDNVTGTYAYSGNRLTGITGGTLATGAYVYDGGGNVITDGRNGVSISYLELNLPYQIVKTGSINLTYVYDATGNKLRKTSGTDVRHYIDGIEYNDSEIEIIHTEEGVARKSGTAYSYEYNLSDHLGNVRYSFKKGPSGNTILPLQKDDYYSFGLRKIAQDGNNKYLYNGKELQEELGQLDYGARFYDPVIGRWNVVDPKAQLLEMSSPYVYALNSPSSFIDKDGELPIYIGGKTNNDSERNSPTYWNAQLLATVAGSGIPNPGNTALFVDGNRYLYQLGNKKEVRRAGLAEGEAEEGRVRAGYSVGKADFKKILSQLERDPKTGKITEKIQIYTHSRGGAFGAGYTEALLEMIKENSDKFTDAVNEIDFVYNMAPHGGSNITSPRGVNAIAHHHDRDKLSENGMNGVIGDFSSSEKLTEGFFGAHANGSFVKDLSAFLSAWQNNKNNSAQLIDDFVKRMKAFGVEVTVH